MKINFVRNKGKNYDLFIIFYIQDLGNHIIPGMFFLYNQLKQGPCATQWRSLLNVDFDVQEEAASAAHEEI